MQQTGTLRKRRKRNLSKVTGKSRIPYDEEKDIFDEGEVGISHSRFLERKISFVSIDVDIETSSLMKIYDNVKSASHNSIHSYHSKKQESNENKGKNKSRKQFEYLLSESTLSRIRQIVLIGALCGAFPWKWNKQKMRIDLWSAKYLKLWNIYWIIYTTQITCITAFQIYSFYMRVKAESATNSYRHIFQSSFSVYWYVCAVYFNVNLYLHKDQMRQYVNTMLYTNKNLVDKYVIEMTDENYAEGGRVLMNFSIPSNLSQILASVTFFCIMPYQPWYLFSYIYQANQPVYYRIPGALQEFNMAGNVITSYVLTSWIAAAHTNTVGFWLREIHRYSDTDYTKETMRHPVTATKIFRSLAVLCCCFNNAMAPLAIPTMKIHTMTGLIPCFYIMIRSMNHLFIDEFPGILTFPIGVFNTITSGFGVLSLAAEMYDLTISFTDSWQQTKHKALRRILKSFPTLKVRVAGFYFITPSTTVTFFKTTIDYIVDCIIAFP